MLKLDDELAQRLRAQAQSRDITLQQWALLIFDTPRNDPTRRG